MKGIKILKSTVVFSPVDVEPKEKKTAQGIILLEDATEQMKSRVFQKGEVISFGMDCQHVKAGSIIYYGKGSATQASLEGETIMMINEDAIFAVVDPATFNMETDTP